MTTAVDGDHTRRESVSEADISVEQNSLVEERSVRSPRNLVAQAKRVGLFFFPTVVILAFGVRLAVPVNGIDEYIYTGTVERLGDYLARFPGSYYAVRFGYILPEIVFKRVFGSQGGYLILRFVMLGVLALCLRNRGRVISAAAFAGAFVVATSPIVLGALFNMYSLSFAVSFTMIGAAMLANASGTSRSDLVLALGAGACLTLGWNAHLTVLPVAAGICAVYAIDQFTATKTLPVWKKIQGPIAIVCGAIAMLLLAVVFYKIRYGINNIFEPTLHQASQDTNNSFREQSANWLTWRHYLLVGPLALVAGLLVWITERRAFARTAVRRLTLSTALGLGAFAIYEWVMKDPLLSIFYYSCIPLGLAVLTFAYSLSVVLSRKDLPRRLILCAAAAVTITAVLAFFDAVKPEYWVILVVGIAGIGFAVASIKASSMIRVASVLVLLAIASWATVSSPHDFRATSSGFRVDPNYDQDLFSYDQSGLDRLNVIRAFDDALPTMADNPGQIRVWFDNTGPMNQVLASMLHYSSAMQSPGQGAMPDPNPFVFLRIRNDRPRYVVILDDSQADVDNGVQQVLAASTYSLVWKKTFESGDYVARAALLEHEAGTYRDYPCIYSGQPMPCRMPFDVP